MKHPTETQLNEYLDGALESPAKARLDAHLSGCAECRARLASLQVVFRALASLSEETPGRDMTLPVLQSLPRRRPGLGWRLVFAVQAGMSLGLLALFTPIVTGHISMTMQGLADRLAGWKVKIPAPVDFHFSIPAIRLPHPPGLTLPFAITHANLPTWFILGTAAILLFVIGNLSLIFRSASENQK
jgi:Putative zinc-finger